MPLDLSCTVVLFIAALTSMGSLEPCKMEVDAAAFPQPGNIKIFLFIYLATYFDEIETSVISSGLVGKGH